MNLTDFFDTVWENYSTINNDVNRIKKAFEDDGNEVINDHIAFRTFGHEKCDIAYFSKFIKQLGYKKVENYEFIDKKLKACYFKHTEDSDAPKIFISELLYKEFSNQFVDYVDKLLESPIGNFSLLQKPFELPWVVPSYEEYEMLRKESEYCAWLTAFGIVPNHFTVYVNKLCTMGLMVEVNTFLKMNGYKILNSGGEVKGSPFELLEQSATVASTVNYKFRDGVKQIPSVFYEFAKRYTDTNGIIFDGFLVNSANKIFESTNVHNLLTYTVK